VTSLFSPPFPLLLRAVRASCAARVSLFRIPSITDEGEDDDESPLLLSLG
jgi:hypothetical protein